MSYFSLSPPTPPGQVAIDGPRLEPDAPALPVLQVLEPSPFAEVPGQSANNDYFPPQTTPSNPTTSKVGITSHSTVYYLKAIQKYSSYAFAVFAALHITNTALIPLATNSISASNTYLLLTRPAYQSALTEPLLVGLPLTTHIAAGIALRINRFLARRTHYSARSGGPTAVTVQEGAEKVKTKTLFTAPVVLEGASWRDDLPPLSWTSLLGYLGLPLLVWHASVTRGLPLRVEGSSSGVGLDFVGHGVALGGESAALAARLVRVGGVVSLAGLVSVVGTHMVWGAAAFWRVLPVIPVGFVSVPADGKRGSVGANPELRLKWKRRWWMCLGVNALLVGVWLAGGVGIVARGGRVEGWVGRAYDEMYRQLPGVRLALE